MGGLFSKGVPEGWTLRHGAACDIGRRSTMEDAHFVLGGAGDGATAELRGPCRGFYVVCDGHGGSDAAQFASKNLLRFFLTDSFLCGDACEALRASVLRLDAEFCKEVARGSLQHSGTTALAAAVLGCRLLVANVGDCRAVLARRGRAIELTRDHKPSLSDERRRIEQAGGYVDGEGYLCGDLGVSRALGDFHYPHLKGGVGEVGPLTAEPEVSEWEIDEDVEFVVLASDGALDSMSSQLAVDIVRVELKRHNDPDRASQAVVKYALEKGVRDNITVVTVCFKQEIAPRTASPISKINPASKSFLSLREAIEGC
ncbi:unnamed protein product [Ostreobium quekettii]|uniref:PPM-type phosphatase domain-containing protein n=1 Tax=Ostreobium quekettii TaxID=121088 RepID=A0A8S1J2I7_9CHLO|nr:unnamed protein product [Ostreobium quekettii]|eukprot:evm.model.scf_1578.2 EVM.evm.TU.scf_1578.2   scf_1578:5811-8465(-)